MGESKTSTKAKAARIAAGSGAILSLGTSLVATAGPAGAATFNVTTTADAGAGSLRQAIADANGAAGPDTITFAPGLGAIALTTGDIDITDPLTITDPEADVTVDAGGTSRIFYLDDNSDAVTLSGLTLTGGNASGRGGAVLAFNTDLTITNSTITGNASSEEGGGVYTFGGDTVTITDSTFSGNTSASYGGGFRASSVDTLVVSGSTFTDNGANGDGGGFDADAVASVTVTDSTFTGNYAGSDGGGLSVYGSGYTESVTVTGITVTGNDSSDQAGGMVVQSMTSGTLAIADSTFSDNDGVLGGGLTIARFDDEGPIVVDVSISGSTFDGNTADNSGGGLYLGRIAESTTTVTTSSFSANEAEVGGGIAAVSAGVATIDSSTVSGNTAQFGGGGIASEGTVLTVTSSTVSGNTATESAGGGIAVYGIDGTNLDISHSTITGNTASFGGGVFLGGYGTATLDHNILDGNVAVYQPVPTAGPTLSPEGSAIFIAAAKTEPPYEQLGTQALDSVTLTNNLVNGTVGGVVVDGGGNLFDLPANLGPLADNGGPTQTHDLLAGSAALDAGSAAFAAPPATDQRGLPRVANARIDIGAVEVQVQTPVVPEPAPPAQPVPADPTFTG